MKRIFSVVSLVLVVRTSWGIFTGTPAGTVISNRAAGKAVVLGVPMEFMSTVETITVGSIYGLSEFNDPQDAYGYPGDVVRFSYIITNMANDADDMARVWISPPHSSSGGSWRAWIEVDGVDVGTNYSIPFIRFGAGAVFSFDVAVEVPSNAVQDDWAYVEVHAETVSNSMHIVGVYTGFNGYIYGGKERVDDSHPDGYDPGEGAHSCVVVVPPNRVMAVRVSDGVADADITHTPITLRRLPQVISVLFRDEPLGDVYVWLGLDVPTDGSGSLNSDDVRIKMVKSGKWWRAGIPLDLISSVSRVYVAFDADGVLYNEGWNYFVRDLYSQESFRTVIMNNVISLSEGQKTYIVVPSDKGGVVKVRFYSVSGELVKSVDKVAQPNSKVVVEWDGRDENGERVAVGIYFAVVKTGEFEEVRQVAVVE